MLQQPADVPQRHLAETGIQSPANSGLPSFHRLWCVCMPLPLSPNSGLGMKVTRLAVLIGHVADDVFVHHHVVGGFHQRVEALIDFALAAGGHFVVVALDVEAALDHGLHHFGAQILIVIGGRDREIAFFVARPVAQVMLRAARIPAALFGVDEVEAGMLVLIEADVIEDEELGFGAEIGGVGEAGILQIHLGLAGDPARVAVVVLARDRIDHVAQHHQRLGFVEGIDEGGVGSGISSMSLSLIAAQPRMLDPSIPKPSSKEVSSSSVIG